MTHVEHKQVNGKYFAYGPYVKEMNLWFRYVSEVVVIAPLSLDQAIDPIDLPYDHSRINFIPVSSFDLLAWKSKFKSTFLIPSIFLKIIKEMKAADHIHLRCPGNMGLLGCLAQVFFPRKPKTAKYAGNWDPKSKQPATYRLQQWILANRFLTKNMQVLVYGDWDAANPNLKPFFTATYKNNEIQPTIPRELNFPLKFIFVGSLVKGKNPIISCKALKLLQDEGIPSELHLYGEGPEREIIERFIADNSLHEKIILHGNVNSSDLKKAYLESHFLLFASKSEGWPKAVAEAMFWGCLPITTRVSCVPEMVDQGKRGLLIDSDPVQIIGGVKALIKNPEDYRKKVEKAMTWSRAFTLERFQSEIKNLLIRG
ncbi:Glycosyltransferase involved in cell wall bisynthesis [Algoriphagus faecimaris]|uniref:Glycosyltransferase involved in cell wall bisynthesis n=2 Tax=Algoriphagus faecimaris TaxID=686796 RepID=A0A1G6PUU5_9BACT|nr:Glycosyltransferase involved in cell wall bisynthesis [Algoriphagus faecimaris]